VKNRRRFLKILDFITDTERKMYFRWHTAPQRVESECFIFYLGDTKMHQINNRMERHQ